MAQPQEKTPEGRILVVDDQENMCWVLSKLLSERGHIVRTAQSGARALRLLDDFDCQVAVVDYRLPDYAGIALIQAMTSRLPPMKAILMTSYGSVSVRRQAVEEGVLAYFDKPFKNDLMIETIEGGVRSWAEGRGRGTGPGAPSPASPGR